MSRFVLLALALAAPASAATHSYSVGGFDRVSSGVPFDIRIHTGAAPSVRADGPQEAIDRLQIGVQNGELVIGSVRGSWWSGWHWGHGQRAVIDVTVPALNGVTLNGPGDMSVDQVRSRSFAARLAGPGDLKIGALEAGHVDVTLNGPGDLTIAGGHAATGTLVLHGPGDIKAAGFTLRDMTVQLAGPGDIDIRATGTAQGTLNGPGDISITGGAHCAITKHGPGDVYCR